MPPQAFPLLAPSSSVAVVIIRIKMIMVAEIITVKIIVFAVIIKMMKMMMVAEIRKMKIIMFAVITKMIIQGVPKNALSECCWSHSALAQSPFAGTPCVWRLIFWSFLTKT